MTCERTVETTQEQINTTVATYRYVTRPVCKDAVAAEACFNPLACPDPPGGMRHSVMRQPIAGGEWESAGTVCVRSGETVDITGKTLTTKDVTARFRQIDWPAATLKIQPPAGETLVNLDTIFYTPSTTPVPKTVTILEQTVHIRATPTSFTWHWVTGDDDRTETETTPLVTNHGGKAHPHQTITHPYKIANSTVHPRLDITYTGGYRLDTQTNWTPIPETRTITGTPQELTVLEARPVLVR